jgi:hypothetical protein
MNLTNVCLGNTRIELQETTGEVLGITKIAQGGFRIEVSNLSGYLYLRPQQDSDDNDNDNDNARFASAPITTTPEPQSTLKRQDGRSRLYSDESSSSEGSGGGRGGIMNSAFQHDNELLAVVDFGQESGEWSMSTASSNQHQHQSPDTASRARVVDQAPDEASPVPKLPSHSMLDQHKNVAVNEGRIREGPCSTSFETALHELCSQRDVALRHLMDALVEDPGAASALDVKGNLPLHILSENEELLSTRYGREDAHDFALELIEAYPESLVIRNNDGRVPFTALIVDWVRRTYERHEDKESSGRGRAPHPFSLHHLTPGGTSTYNSKDVLHDGNTGVPSATPTSRSLPLEVVVHPAVEWNFSMLSLGLDHIHGKYTRGRPRSRHVSRTSAAALAINVATIPELIKTLLLVEDLKVRRRILELPIMRRVLLRHESAGSWIVSMLRRKGNPSKRAIDYLVELSALTLTDFTGSFRTPRPEDIDAFNEERTQVFKVVEELEDLIQSLVVLEDKQLERAASSEIVWRTLTLSLSRPFIVSVIVIDLLLHVGLMVAYRGLLLLDYTPAYLSRLDSPTPLSLSSSSLPTEWDELIQKGVVVAVCTQFFLRKAAEGIMFARISFSVFKSYFFDFWSLLEILCIVCACASIPTLGLQAHYEYPIFKAFVLGLLWLKVCIHNEKVLLPQNIRC